MGTRVFDEAWAEQRARLRALERWLDVGSQRLLDRIGLERGWRCLEVGAGAGSIVRFLASRVGPEGHVVGVDADTRHLDWIEEPNVSIRTLGSLTHSKERFDLAHARAIAGRLPSPVKIINAMTASLEPGGTIMVEEIDLESLRSVRPAPAWERALAAWIAMLGETGVDAAAGRNLPGLLRAAGVTGVESEARSSIARGEDAWIESHRLTLEWMRSPLVASGRVRDADIDAAVAELRDPSFEAVAPLVVAAWGRAPST